MKPKKIPRKAKNTRHLRSPLDIGMEILAIIALVTAALIAPQIIFQVQDTILCTKTTLGERENMDVEVLRTTYERSLSKRLANFAEGVSAGDHFYYTSQDISEEEDVLWEYLNYREGLYSEVLTVLIDLSIVPVSFLDQCQVNAWKQYVIYSDNYAKGVNFILWYVELVNRETGGKLRLLTDAETGTIYAAKTIDCNELFYNSDGNYLYSNSWMEEMAPAFWYYYGRYYEAMNTEESEAYLQKRQEELWNDVEEEAWNDDSSANASLAASGDWMENAGYRVENHQMLFRLPFGTSSLEVLLWIGDLESDSKFIYWYPDASVGIRQIYELIPEFA